MIGSICIITSKPLGDELSTLAVRAAYTTFNMGLESNLLLIGDGVYNALKNSQGYKADTMKAYMGDEGEVKVHQKSLEERGLSEGDLMEGVQVINDDEVASLMESFEAFSTF